MQVPFVITRVDNCKAVSVKVITGLYLMVSPKCCLTFSVILETDNDIEFGCNNNCHSNYYLFHTSYFR